MTLGSGFGTGPFGEDPFGETNFARKILLENLPQVYIDEDVAQKKIFTRFIRALYPNTNEFRDKLDRFPLIRGPEEIPPDAITFPTLVQNLQPEIQSVSTELPIVIPGNQITIVGENPAETITVTVILVENDLSRIQIGTPFPFATSVRTVRVRGETFSFLVTNGSQYIVAVPDIFPDVKNGDYISIGGGDTRFVVTSVTPDLFKFNVFPSPTVLTGIDRFDTIRLSRLILLTLLAKDIGLTDDPTKLEAIRRGLVLHAVEYYKLKGTAKGYQIRGALEGLITDVFNFQQTPCVASTAQFIPIAIGDIVTVAAADILDGEGVFISDGVNPVQFFEFDKDGVLSTLRLENDVVGAAGNVPISYFVADPDFLVFGMDGGSATRKALGTLTAVPGASLIDGEIFTISDGVNPPTIFEFDDDGIVTPGNVGVPFTAFMSAVQVMNAMLNAVNSVGAGLAVTASINSVPVTLDPTDTGPDVARKLAQAINGVALFAVSADFATDSDIVDLRNVDSGLGGVIPLIETVADTAFVANGMLPYNGVKTDTEKKSLQPLMYESEFDLSDVDTGTVDSPSFEKYFDLGSPATGSITAIAGALLADGETFTIADGENTPVTFEFDKNNSVVVGNVPVGITNLMSAFDVAAAIEAAINSVPVLLRVSATNVLFSTVITLKNDTPSNGSRNVPITDTVVNPGFICTGMAGGSNIEDEQVFPVLYPDLNVFFSVAGVQFQYNPGPGPDQITLLSVADLVVGDVVEFGLQQKVVSVAPGVSPLPEVPSLQPVGTIITFTSNWVGLGPNGTAVRMTRQPDINPMGDFLTIAGFDYKVVQFSPSTFGGATDLVLRDLTLAGQIVAATRTRRRAVTRRAAFDWCRLPVLKLRVEAAPLSLFFAGFEGFLKFLGAIDEVKPIHVRFEDIEFVQEIVIPFPVIGVGLESAIEMEPLVPVNNYYDSEAAEDLPADSPIVVTVETP